MIVQEVDCGYCRKIFLAREADIKRGWGKFCSKSCKASKQKPYPRIKTEKTIQRMFDDIDNDDWVSQGDDWEACDYHNN